MNIGIIDYGSGNLHSVHNAVRHAAAETNRDDHILRVTVAEELAACDRIILPGLDILLIALRVCLVLTA